MACGIFVGLLFALPIGAEPPAQESSRIWTTLVADAKALRLPTQFLEQIPASFVAFEFEDLHAFAAEYHPGEHRMVLNRSLSLNAAGRTLRPLRGLTHKELDTLYHELFHAYVDFLVHAPAPSAGQAALLAFARAQQQCRYQQVWITPVVQKKDQKEERFLSEAESWEVVNETWAVFVGWAIWTQLEVAQPTASAGRDRQSMSPARLQAGWVARLEQAERDADLRGYYEPENPQEKAMARKRFLAPEFRLSAGELTVLLRDVLGRSPDAVRGAVAAVLKVKAQPPAKESCDASSAP